MKHLAVILLIFSSKAFASAEMIPPQIVEFGKEAAADNPATAICTLLAAIAADAGGLKYQQSRSLILCPMHSKPGHLGRCNGESKDCPYGN
jgi:hypothetical protein